MVLPGKYILYRLEPMHFTHSTKKKSLYIFYALVYQTKYDILLVHNAGFFSVFFARNKENVVNYLHIETDI